MKSASIGQLTLALFLMLLRFPAILYGCMVMATGLPELAFVFSLLICEDMHQQIFAPNSTLKSKLFAIINLCALLTAVIVSGTPRLDVALVTVVAYFVLSAVGKPLLKTGIQDASDSTCTSFVDSSNCDPPAPVQVKAPIITAPIIKGPQLLAPEIGTPEPPAEQIVPPWRRNVCATPVEESSGSDVPKLPSANETTCDAEVPNINAEIHKIIQSGMPNPADEKLVRKLVQLVRRSVQVIIPEAVVHGQAMGNLAYIAAQDAKPEVEICVMVDNEVLERRLKEWYLRGPTGSNKKTKDLATLHPDTLQKTATRVLSERLKNLRYWRSQFTGPEPRTVLVAPVSLGLADFAVLVSFSVNNPYPKNLSDVFTKGDKQFQDLGLLVMKWARCRGIANTGKNHLHLYGYLLLVIFFLREIRRTGNDIHEKPLLELFQDFFVYYKTWFENRDSPVHVCFTPGHDTNQASFPPEDMLWEIPFIEDPYNATKNVAAAMSADSAKRLREEFVRAVDLSSRGLTSLAELIEQWVPPVHQTLE